MLIEPLNESNLNDLTNLYVEMFPDTDHHEEWQMLAGILRSKTESCFLVKESNQYVGFIHLALRSDYVEGSEHSPTAYIEAIYVKPGFRRKGIAAALLKKAEAWALTNNSPTLASDTEISNAAGIQFHQHLGFAEANRIVCFIKKLAN